MRTEYKALKDVSKFQVVFTTEEQAQKIHDFAFKSGQEIEYYTVDFGGPTLTGFVARDTVDLGKIAIIFIDQQVVRMLNANIKRIS